jgi:hypothetical protein
MSWTSSPGPAARADAGVEVGGRGHGEAVAFQRPAHGDADHLVVLDQQQ